MAMRISVIIPTLNEAAALPAALASLRTQKPHEIIVVDGGSSDGTTELAGEVRVLTGVRGRAAQMNFGAKHATSDGLLFLHADCTLEDGALDEAARLLQRPNVAAGCFRMTVPRGEWLYRSIDASATARVRLFGIIYGDQGLFLRRDVFERVGGFPELRLMEDVFLSLKLRRLGRVVVARSRIYVSARRWQRVGIVRQTLRNWALTAAATAGVHPDRLARYYPVVR
jgi:rSAM/selenodomain-associated transferase 2